MRVDRIDAAEHADIVGGLVKSRHVFKTLRDSNMIAAIALPDVETTRIFTARYSFQTVPKW